VDLRQLRYFVSVAQTGSLSKSAVLLSVSQPALSRQLAGLEEKYGLPLLCRTGRGVTLTEPGKQLLTYAQVVLENIKQMERELLAMQQSPVGQAIIGLPPMIGDFLTVPLVQRFREKFPKVSLHIIEGLSGHIHEWLSTGKVDVAILYNAPNTSTVIAEPLLKDDLWLIGVSKPEGLKDDTAPFSLLSQLPLIMPSKPHGLRGLIESVASKQNIKINVDIDVDAFHAMIELVQSGLGYTILPFVAVHKKVQQGLVQAWHIVEPRATGVLSLAASTQRARTPATRHLVEIVREQVRLMVKTGAWVQKDQPAPVGPLPSLPARISARRRRPGRVPHVRSLAS
jgi:LysR family transcriptional regulator, nitrogen assimilation regulatory protein